MGRLGRPQAVREEFGHYREDPAGFCADVLGFTSATRRSDGTAYQLEALEMVRDNPASVLVCGHGVGKTATDAVAAIWWLLTRPLSRVIILAPQFQRQIQAIIWAEIRKRARKSRRPLPIEVKANRVIVEGYGDEWGAIGVPATEPDRIEGFHAEGGLLLLMDEAKGIPQDVVDAMQGALTGGDDSRLLFTSTPGGQSGPLWKAWTAAEGWHRMHVPATDSSQVSQRWIEGRRREWGEESPLFKARVLGEFPSEADGTLFPLALLEAAAARDLAGTDKVTLGVDVARSTAGDQNCVAVARGGRLEELILWRSPDTMLTVSRVLEVVTARAPGLVRVDVGGVGAGVADRLRQLGVPVEAVHFGGGAADPSRFRNRRAEMAWGLREGLEAGVVALPEDDALFADLGSLRYFFTQDGRIQLESKDEVRARVGRSPDRGDAVMLAIGAGLSRRPIIPAAPALMSAPSYWRDSERQGWG